MLKRWMNMGDDRVSDGCIENGNAGWIDNKEAFPSGHQFPPRFPGCRCGCGSRVGDRKDRSGLPDDRWIVTRQGDKVVVKPNPKYANGYDKPIVDAPVQPSIITPAGKSVDDLYNDVVGVYNAKRGEYLQLKDRRDKLNAELIKASDETLQLIRKANHIEDDAEYFKLKEKIDAMKTKQGELINARNTITDELNAFKQKGRDEIHEMLYHGQGGSIVNNISKSGVLSKSKTANKAMEFMEKVISPDTQSKIAPAFKASNIKRANARYWDQAININAKANVGTYVHEMGHLFEKDEKIFNAVNEFYSRRTAGEKSEQLYKGKREYTYKDRFINPYTGRIYRWGGAKDPEPTSGIHLTSDRRYATEVVSMGAQHLYEIPGEFAIKDPEHFKLIMEIFRGMI